MKKMVALVLAGTMMAGMASVAMLLRILILLCGAIVRRIIRWQILKAIRS